MRQLDSATKVQCVKIAPKRGILLFRVQLRILKILLIIQRIENNFSLLAFHEMFLSAEIWQIRNLFAINDIFFAEHIVDLLTANSLASVNGSIPMTES